MSHSDSTTEEISPNTIKFRCAGMNGVAELVIACDDRLLIVRVEDRFLLHMIADGAHILAIRPGKP